MNDRILRTWKGATDWINIAPRRKMKLPKNGSDNKLLITQTKKNLIVKFLLFEVGRMAIKVSPARRFRYN